jgi:hypothetical protein
MPRPTPSSSTIWFCSWILIKINKGAPIFKIIKTVGKQLYQTRYSCLRGVNVLDRFPNTSSCHGNRKLFTYLFEEFLISVIRGKRISCSFFKAVLRSNWISLLNMYSASIWTDKHDERIKAEARLYDRIHAKEIDLNPR